MCPDTLSRTRPRGGGQTPGPTGRALHVAGAEAPPCPPLPAAHPTDSVLGLSFALCSDFRPMSSPGRGWAYFLTVLWIDLSRVTGETLC